MTASPELISFIRTQLERGVPKEQIFSDLTKQGWPQEAAEAAFAEVSGGVPAPQPPVAGEDTTVQASSTGEADTTLAGPIELCKRAWSTYTSRLKIILMVAALPMIISLLMKGIPALIKEADHTNVAEILTNPSFLVVSAIVGVLLAVLFIYLSTWFQLALFSVIRRDTEAQDSVRGALNQSRPFVFGYFWISILIFLVFLGGFLLLVIPGIWLLVSFMFVTFVLFFENERGLAALRRSKAYVSGYWFPVAFRLLVWLILLVVVQLIASVIISAVFSNASNLAWTIEISFSSLVTVPIAVIYAYELYRSLRSVRGEITVEKSTLGTLGYIALAILPFLLLFFVLVAAGNALNQIASETGMSIEEIFSSLAGETDEESSGLLDEQSDSLVPQTMLVRAQLVSIGDLIEVQYESTGRYPQTLSEIELLRNAGFDLTQFRYQLSSDGSEFSLCTDIEQKELCYSELKTEQLLR